MESPFFRFSNLSEFPEIVHGISTRHYGNMSLHRDGSEKTIQNREHFFSDMGISPKQVVMAGMVHGSKIVNVGKSEQGRGINNHAQVIKGSDGLITTANEVFLMVTAADCLPLMAYDPVNRVVAIAHVGWRGIIAGVVGEVIEKFKLQGSQSEDIVVGIGPGICQRHFVVKNDVLEQFLNAYPSAVFVRNKDGYIDLRKAIINHLIRAGYHKSNIEISHYCPMCNNNLFGSHRLERESAPAAAAVIGKKP